MENLDLSKRIYARNEREWTALCQKRCLSDKKLGVQKVERAVVLPPRKIPGQFMDIFEGGVCDEALDFIAGSIRITPEHPGYLSVMRSYRVPKEEIEYIDEEVIYGGVLLGHFGHFLMEDMARFWYFLQNAEKKRIIFLNVWGWHSWMEDFFRLLALDKSQYFVVDRPMQFSSVTIPEESVHCFGGFCTKEYLIPYHHIKQHVPGGTSFPKIYLTRRQHKSPSYSANEEYFEEYFRAKGFAVLSPEQYSIPEQIRFIMDAEEICCTAGSLSHFAMFCRPGTKFIILTRSDFETLPPQCIINEISEVDWYIVDTSMNFLYGERGFSGVLLMGASPSWKRFALDYFGDVISDDTIRDAGYDYMVRWCKWAASPKILQKLDGMDFVKLFRQFYRNIMGTEPPESCPDHSPAREALHLKIMDLERRLASSENWKEAFCASKKLPVVASYEVKTLQGGWSPVFYQGQAYEGTHFLIGFRISINDASLSCQYQVYHPEKGWSKTFEEGEEASNGEGALPLFGMKITLRGREAKKYDLVYQLHHPAKKWSPEVHSGSSISTDTAPLNSIRLRLLKRK